MKNTIRALTLLACITTAALIADTAHAFTFTMGGGSWIDTSGTNSVLKLDVNQMNPDLDGWTFDLDVGQTSDRIHLATIGTTEGWINRDDRRWGSVIAYIDIDIPELTERPAMGGKSKGFARMGHFVQGWKLRWDDPLRIITASGLDFSIDLKDERYKSWWWNGPDGSADIYATVTLNQAPVPLPEPLLLFGTGMISIIALRRRK